MTTTMTDAELRTDLHKRYFATLRDLEMKERRKEWQEKVGLPASTKEWTIDDYKRAVTLLVQPVRDQYHALCRRFNINPLEYSEAILGNPPDVCKDYQVLIQQLAGEHEAEQVHCENCAKPLADCECHW